MKNIIQSLLNSPHLIGFHVPFSDVTDIEKFEERFHEVERVFGDIVGIDEDGYEFCPNHEPPDTKTELLPWLWLLHPELYEEIKALGNQDLRRMIDEYEEDLRLPLMRESELQNLHSLQTDDLIGKFQEASRQHHFFTVNHEWRKGNREMEVIHGIVNVLQSREGEGLLALHALVVVSDPAIALMAAIYTLEYDSNACLATLRELEAADLPNLSMTASYAIQNWKDINSTKN